MSFFRFLVAFCCLLSLSLTERIAESEERVPAKRPAEDARPAPSDQPLPADQTEALPLWEVGLGGGGGWTPDYPAAGQNHFRGLPPLPFVKYRGEFFQAGERSLARGLFVDTDKFELDLSLAGSLPADSSKNDARDGMDDLDFLGEIGPRVSYFFTRDEAGNHKRFDIALRGVFSTDFSEFDYVGLVLHPYYAQEFVDVIGIEDFDTEWSIGARWGDEGLMDLFYEVDADDVRANRAAFDAKPGYLGTNLYGAFSYPVTDDLKLALAGTVASYHGAKNRDSDLFVDEWNVGIGFAAIWTIWKSETLSKTRRRCAEDVSTTLACPGQ